MKNLKVGIKKVNTENKIQKKKVAPFVAALILLCAFSVYFFFGSNQYYTGVVEASIISHTSEVSGKIMEMPISLGTHISKGDVIAVIDSTNQQYNLDQLELTLEKKKLAFSQLDTDSSDNSQAKDNISIASAGYKSALSANKKASQDYNDAITLYNEGAISKDALENARVKADAAASTLASAKAQLDISQNQSSAESMAIDIAQTESQIKQMKDSLGDCTVLAEADGIVMSKSYLPGDMVSPGFQLADIASDHEKYFVFYLPVEKLSYIEYEDIISVKADDKNYDAVVKFIDVESEYTPKDMQTAANKNRESVKIKLLLPENCPLKAGQEAQIHLENN